MSSASRCSWTPSEDRHNWMSERTSRQKKEVSLIGRLSRQHQLNPSYAIRCLESLLDVFCQAYLLPASPLAFQLNTMVYVCATQHSLTMGLSLV